MNCQNCHEIVEPGAAFCGNCGQPLQITAPTVSPLAQAAQYQQPVYTNNQPPTVIPQPIVPPINPNGIAPSVPSYAIATPNQHAGETQALLSVILGVIGIAGSGFLIPLIGFVFGIAGLIMGTIARRISHRRLAIVGLILSSLAIAAGSAALVYNLQHNKNASTSTQTGQSTKSSKVTSRLTTPCYSFNLIDQFNVSNSSGSCDSTVFNNQTFETSTDVYKIVAFKAATNDPGTFTELAKQGVDKDIQDNLPGFNIVSEGPASFAGGLAYTAYTYNKSQDSAIVETVILHKSSSGNDAFDILHGVNGKSTNFQALEAQWQWK